MAGFEGEVPLAIANVVSIVHCNRVGHVQDRLKGVVAAALTAGVPLGTSHSALADGPAAPLDLVIAWQQSRAIRIAVVHPALNLSAVDAIRQRIVIHALGDVGAGRRSPRADR